MRTEFRPRLVKADDIEAAKREYDTLVQGVGSLQCLCIPLVVPTTQAFNAGYEATPSLDQGPSFLL